MQRMISIEEANILAAYEPIDSEFRSQAYTKWRNVQVVNNTCGPCWRSKERAVKTLTLAKNCHKGTEPAKMIFDYFPLDKEESETPASSSAPEMLVRPAGKLSLFRRVSIRFRMSFLKRSTYRRNRNTAIR